MPMSGLPEDAIERFFEKSSEKRERFQKFWKYTRCGRFFSKMVELNQSIRERNWTVVKNFEFFSKTVILKRPVRERNLMGTQWR